MEKQDFKMIGTIIRRCRKNKGLTQSALSKQLGVSVQHLVNWELGSALPPDKYWKKINKILVGQLDGYLVKQFSLYVQRKMK